ncbi:MAG: BatD family protein, partial [Porticoccus sp.]|nr:BatD family protein [Porticoccus sp.]
MIPTYYSTVRTLLAVLFCLTSTVTLADTLTASVDRNQLSKGETLELLVQFDRQTTSDPDFAPLNDDFEVLSRQQKNKFSLMNGNSTSYTEWRLQLLPKKTGKLQIPSLSFKGVVSTPITLQVQDRRQTSTTTSNQPVFVETDVDKSSAYVQEQLLITFRINASTNLQSISSEELMIKDASVMKVSENQYQKQINGINHLVIELQYAIFPESSGNLTIPAIRFNTVIPDRRDPYSNSFFSRGGKRVFLYSEEKKITIKPRPTSYGSTEWLPTTAVSLSERWSRPLDKLVAGEPITRTIYLSAQGLTSAQLPPLDINAGDGFKVYPDQPQLNDDVSSNGVMGTREESIAIVPSRGGTITLPAITVKWWDTASNQMRETVLDSKTLTIKPAENTISVPESVAETPSTAETPLIENQQPGLIFWLLIMSNVLLLGVAIAFLILWRVARKKAFAEPAPSEDPPERKEAALFKQLQQQAKSNSPSAFREALMVWASTRWQRPLVTLDEVAIVANDPLLTTELEALDRALYSPDASTTIDLDCLLEQLKTLRKQPMGEKLPKGNHLQPLYA